MMKTASKCLQEAAMWQCEDVYHSLLIYPYNLWAFFLFFQLFRWAGERESKVKVKEFFRFFSHRMTRTPRRGILLVARLMMMMILRAYMIRITMSNESNFRLLRLIVARLLVFFTQSQLSAHELHLSFAHFNASHSLRTRVKNSKIALNEQ